MQEINKNSVGLVIGLFFGLAHLVWAIIVAMGLAKPLLDWILHLHFMSLSYSMNAFKVGNALVLVILTFVCGYVAGWVFAALWNAFRK